MSRGMIGLVMWVACSSPSTPMRPPPSQPPAAPPKAVSVPPEPALEVLEQSGSIEDRKRAIARYETACAAGEMSACERLARELESGTFVELDITRATALRETACEHDRHDACFALATQYDNGTTSQRTRARELFERSCKGGHSWSCSRSDNDQRAFDLELEKCNAGDASACTEAEHFARQTGVRGDVPKERWKAIRDQLEAECANANGASCSLLAGLLRSGYGGQRDRFDRVDELNIKACELGDRGACSYLTYFAQGPAAIERFGTRACDAGMGEACDKLASVTPDPSKARALRRRACAFGHLQACSELASELAKAGDVAGARELRSRECVLQVANECLELAVEYEKAGDPQRALIHYNRACERGIISTGCTGALRYLHSACAAGERAACEAETRRLTGVPKEQRDAVAYACCATAATPIATPGAAVMAFARAVRAQDAAALAKLIHPKRGMSARFEMSGGGSVRVRRVKLTPAKVASFDLLETLSPDEHAELQCDEVKGATATCSFSHAAQHFGVTFTVLLEGGVAWLIEIDGSGAEHG
jgi:TPR repeat protein